MRRMHSLMVKWWDFDNLLETRPVVNHLHAFKDFLELWEGTEDFLQHTMFPNPSKYPGTARTWAIGSDDACVQYMLLTNKLRDANKSDCYKNQWLPVCDYMVSSMHYLPLVKLIVDTCARRSSVGGHKRVLVICLISEYIGD